MHAGETKVQTIIDSQRQYVIPLFQRPYSWESPQWATLWQDLAELCEDESPRNHFIGSIVTMPSKSVVADLRVSQDLDQRGDGALGIRAVRGDGLHRRLPLPFVRALQRSEPLGQRLAVVLGGRVQVRRLLGVGRGDPRCGSVLAAGGRPTALWAGT